MDHLEVIKLSRKLDVSGSIMLSTRYTPLIDIYLEDSSADDADSRNKNYLFDGSQTIVADQKWISLGTILITKKQGNYHLVVGHFGPGARLIESFLKTVFERSYERSTKTPFLCSFEMNNRVVGATWIPTQFINALDLSLSLGRVSQTIVDRFMQNKKYAVMIFNASPWEKKYLPFYIQQVLISSYKKAGHVWLNIDLTRGNFSLTDEVLSEVSMSLPSIASYVNIIAAYRDAVAANTFTYSSKGFGRYSTNKQSLTAIFDKIGDTEGAISIVFCDCANIQELDKLSHSINTKEVEIQSFYRRGRIDAELTVTGGNTPHLFLYDKATGDELRFFKP